MEAKVCKDHLVDSRGRVWARQSPMTTACKRRNRNHAFTKAHSLRERASYQEEQTGWISTTGRESCEKRLATSKNQSAMLGESRAKTCRI
ncbi:hypothetical protein TrVE_jg3814 [Triparma verrucosa]|uniref:Uncharacterized protein n=1 Tax=Triparma verrucosa TaxID=1606542 RepID=A0A9W6ZAH0_9STRA|nr:hypothetical protein TrVE_jg3814 [Triparma verrucosa]